MIISFLAILSLISVSASSAEEYLSCILNATSLAPPCFGPLKAPIEPVIQEYISEFVPAITLEVNVEALNSCSAYKIKDTCIALTQDSLGFSPCNKCKKCPPIVSSSVTTLILFPLYAKWYQYKSIEPKDAINLLIIS